MAASPLFPGLPRNWKEELLPARGPSPAVRIWFDPHGTRDRGLFIVHGFGEQSDRYSHLPHFLRTSVDSIAALDLPGHGLSEGQRGHCDRFDQMTAAALAGFARYRSWLGGRGAQPALHWMGHSFGGLVTLRILAAGAPEGARTVLLSAPLVALSMPVPRLKRFFGELIAPVLPRLPLDNEIEPSKLSREPTVGEEYRRNPLNHSKITPRMFTEMTKAMKETRGWPGPLPLPGLVILPGRDEVVDSRMTLSLARAWKETGSKPVEISIWPGASHESLNDFDKPQIFNAIEGWLRMNDA